MKALIGCAAIIIALAAVRQRGKGMLKALPLVGLQGIIRDTMGYWERRLAALSDVTKQTSAIACKKNRRIDLTAICEMTRNASSLSPDTKTYMGRRDGPFRRNVWICNQGTLRGSDGELFY